MSRLEVEGIGVAARDGTRLLTDVSLVAEAGSCTCVIGPNGAGKTSLLRAVAGVVNHSGAVLIDGVELASLARRERARRVAMVAQRPTLPEGMATLDYVLLGRTAHLPRFGAPGPRDRAAALEVLDRLGAAALADRRLTTLSGGELGRVAVARGLAQRAGVLLLDEPTSALDVGAQLEVCELVAQLRAGGDVTIVATLHDLALVTRLADRVHLLDGGRLVASGDPAAVLAGAPAARAYGVSLDLLDDGRDGWAVVARR
ncbi:MAG: hypothetical protein JWM98_2299 [Thermoleophilia bacterium]|nr:hypothetical protein [Thermoleophilia bacterium]